MDQDRQTGSVSPGGWRWLPHQAINHRRNAKLSAVLHLEAIMDAILLIAVIYFFLSGDEDCGCLLLLILGVLLAARIFAC